MWRRTATGHGIPTALKSDILDPIAELICAVGRD